MASAWREEQRLPRVIVAIVIAAAFVPWILTLTTGRPAASLENMLGWLVVALIGLWLSRMRMVTEVSREGIAISFPWLWPTRRIPFPDLAGYHAVKYNPLLEFGGWGVRFGFRRRAYNMRGDRGVELLLRDGRRILIGSQRPEDLVAALDAARRSGTP